MRRPSWMPDFPGAETYIIEPSHHTPLGWCECSPAGISVVLGINIKGGLADKTLPHFVKNRCPMKAMIILNPHAHSGTEPQALEALHDEISAHLKSALQLKTVEWRKTEYPGHGKKLAEEAARKGYDYVFAGGGDGTVNEVLNGIMGLKEDQK